jgi:hypothetical protein
MKSRDSWPSSYGRIAFLSHHSTLHLPSRFSLTPRFLRVRFTAPFANTMATRNSFGREPPREPTRIDHIVAIHGGTTAAIETLPTQMNKTKRRQAQHEPVSVQDLSRKIGLLQAENACAVAKPDRVRQHFSRQHFSTPRLHCGADIHSSHLFS